MISWIYTMLCKPYTQCVNLYTHCVNSRCFVENLPSFQFTHLCVKFWPQKLRSGKSFDKYHVFGVLPFREDSDLSVTAGPAVAQLLPPWHEVVDYLWRLPFRIVFRIHRPLGQEWLIQLRKCLQLNKIPTPNLCSLLQRPRIRSD